MVHADIVSVNPIFFSRQQELVPHNIIWINVDIKKYIYIKADILGRKTLYVMNSYLFAGRSTV
jgi:hypothetical protein